MSLKEGSVILLVVTSLLETEVSLIVPDFNILCMAVHAILSFLVSFSLFSVNFLAFRPVLGVPVRRKRRTRSKNETKKREIITWTAVHRNCNILDY